MPSCTTNSNTAKASPPPSKRPWKKKAPKVAVFEGLNAGDKDFSSIIQKLKQANVDFVYYGGYHPELGLILRQAKEKGLNAKFMGPEGVGNDSISQIAQGASEGLLVTLPKSFDTDPANKAIVEEFTKNKQDPTGPFVFPAYSAIEVIAGGITAAKSEDTAKVAAAIHAGTFKTPTGELSFDAKGDLKDFKFVVYEWHFGKPKTESFPSVSQALTGPTSPLCEQWALFYEVYGPVTRDPGAGSPENLKTVTSGSLANALCEMCSQNTAQGRNMTPPVKCVSGF